MRVQNWIKNLKFFQNLKLKAKESQIKNEISKLKTKVFSL